MTIYHNIDISSYCLAQLASIIMFDIHCSDKMDSILCFSSFMSMNCVACFCVKQFTNKAKYHNVVRTVNLPPNGLLFGPSMTVSLHTRTAILLHGKGCEFSKKIVPKENSI